MADLEKTVKIIFEGQDKDLIKSVKNIASKFEDFDFMVGKVTEPLSKAADAVFKVDAALAALVVGGLALAIRESKNFNQGFALISTSVSATGSDLSEYRQKILDYATTSVKSIDDINAALYTAAQAGVKYTDSLEFMSKSEQLAVANNANLNTTVDLLTGTMNAYGYTVKDVGHLNDVFFQSTLVGKQTIDELGQSMGQVVGIAANAGVSFEELQAAIATLTAKGMNTPDAITAIKAAITTIISPSAEAAKAANELGLNFSASSLKANGFAGMITKIMTATGGSTDKMTELFNEVRAMNGVMQLTGDGMAFFRDALNQVANSAGASEAAYKKMVGTFANQSQMLINNAKTLFIDVGTKLEPVAANIAGSFSKLLTGIKVGIDAGAFDDLFAYMDEAGKQLSTWISGVAKALPEALKGLDFSKLIASLKDLGGAFAEYLGNMDLTNVDDLHKFIQKLIDGIAGLVEVTRGMVDGFRPLFTAFTEFLVSVADSDEESQRMLGTLMAMAKAIETFGLGLVAAGLIVDQYGLTISGLFNIIAGGTQFVFNRLQQAIDEVRLVVLELEENVLGVLNALSLGSLGRFSETFNNIRAVVTESITSIKASMTENSSDAARGLDKIVSGFSSLETQSDKTTVSVKNTGKSINDIPSEKETTIKVDDKEVDQFTNKMKNESAVSVYVKASPDKQSFEDTENVVYSKFSGQVMKITTELDGTTTIQNMTEINKAFPSEKKVDVKPDITQTALAEIREKSEIVQKSIEWKAKIDIAQIESATKIIEAAFTSVNNTISDTGKTMSSLFETYTTILSNKAGGESFIEQQIVEESKRRDRALDLEEDLVRAQISNMNARTAALNRGSALIEIDGKGLQPQLEAFMFEILKSIQVRANAEGSQFLVGI